MKFAMPALVVLLAAGSAQADSATDANKRVAARVFEDIYHRRDFAAANDIYAPDFVIHVQTRDAVLAEDLAASRV